LKYFIVEAAVEGAPFEEERARERAVCGWREV
jgi:hypothetical protein